MSEPTIIPPGRLAGIDYGTVRIGIALSDARQTMASPADNYTRRGPQADALYFTRLAREERIVAFVVGLPVHLDGYDSAKSVEARAFGRWLGELTGLPIVYADERYTSREAEDLLLAVDMPRRQRKARLDKLAAQILLSGFLEHRRSDASPAPLDDRPAPRRGPGSPS